MAIEIYNLVRLRVKTPFSTLNGSVWLISEVQTFKLLFFSLRFLDLLAVIVHSSEQAPHPGLRESLLNEIESKKQFQLNLHFACPAFPFAFPKEKRVSRRRLGETAAMLRLGQIQGRQGGDADQMLAWQKQSMNRVFPHLTIFHVKLRQN